MKVLKTKTILIVDDDAKIIKSTKRVLDRCFYKVLVANSGKEALKVLENNSVDLILSDYSMDDGDGLFLLENVNKDYQIPVIIMTGHASLEVAIEFANKHCYKFIEKPFDRDKFLAIAGELEDFLQDKEQTEELVNLGESISCIMHEINNPLSVIGLRLNKLTNQIDGKENDTTLDIEVSDLNSIEKNSLKIIKIDKDVKDLMSSNKQLEFENFPLETIQMEIEDLQESMESSVNIVYENFEDKFIYGDPGQVSLVFVNLIKNALEAIGDDDKGEIVLKVIESNDKLIVEVQDNGPGISEDVKDKLFDRGISFKAGGTGFGLFLVKKAMERQGAKISIESCKPTIFKLEFIKAEV